MPMPSINARSSRRNGLTTRRRRDICMALLCYQVSDCQAHQDMAVLTSLMTSCITAWSFAWGGAHSLQFINESPRGAERGVKRAKRVPFSLAAAIVHFVCNRNLYPTKINLFFGNTDRVSRFHVFLSHRRCTALFTIISQHLLMAGIQREANLKH